MTDLNYSLRDHVTRTGFDLSLGKTHIAALVYIDQVLKINRPSLDPKTDQMHSLDTPRRRPWNHFATGVHGLEERGLVVHIAELRRKPGENVLHMTPRRIWRITPAGRLVIGLLKEAGIYQEYASVFPMAAGEAS